MNELLDLLRARGAATIEHPGGTLLAHLVRVADRLADLGLPKHVCDAGLTHAVYGTDGFDVTLLSLDERDLLRGLAGIRTELLVYRYGGCDRKRSWRALADTRAVWNRFEDRAETLDDADLRDLVDLSIVNELDVLDHAPGAAERYGDYFRSLFASWAPLASPSVLASAATTLSSES